MPNELALPEEMQHLLEKREAQERRQSDVDVEDERRAQSDRRKESQE